MSLEPIADPPIFWGRCVCACGCQSGTGPFLNRSYAENTVCADCENGLCIVGHEVDDGPGTLRRVK